MNLSCPPEDAGPWAWYEATFAADVSFAAVAFGSATIDYGDGRSFASPTLEDANANLLWHRYHQPGSFTVTLTVTDSAGQTDQDNCVFTWSDTEGASGKSCDPNYSGCVPIASEVDCSGGSGDGPTYTRGPVQVIGVDIYGLDGNNDGWGCE